MTFLPEVLHDAEPLHRTLHAAETLRGRHGGGLECSKGPADRLSCPGVHPLSEMLSRMVINVRSLTCTTPLAGSMNSKTDDWRTIWAAGAASAANQTGDLLTAMTQGGTDPLGTTPGGSSARS